MTLVGCKSQAGSTSSRHRGGQVNAMDLGEKRSAQQDASEGDKSSLEPPAATVGATTVTESLDNPGDKVPSQKRARPNDEQISSDLQTTRPESSSEGKCELVSATKKLAAQSSVLYFSGDTLMESHPTGIYSGVHEKLIAARLNAVRIDEKHEPQQHDKKENKCKKTLLFLPFCFANIPESSGSCFQITTAKALRTIWPAIVYAYVYGSSV